MAAVRLLGDSGVDVGVVTDSRLRVSAATWSRRTARSYFAPPESDPRFIERLLAIGAAKPGQILLPTSDETAWLYTQRAAELEKIFCLYQPSLLSMQRILDKKLLADAARKVGIAVVPSWEPKSLADVIALAPGLPYPILIKRRTHVNHATNFKGVVVKSPVELTREYEKFLSSEEFVCSTMESIPDAKLPFLQQLLNVGIEGVCSITGFIDRTGELFVTRRSKKVFQRTQPVGIGVCFESLPDDPTLSGAVRRLCAELEYFGLFEVEFLWLNGTWAVIDFNPRLFNQLELDICRGMPLPLFACLDAARDSARLRDAVAIAVEKSHDNSVLPVFYDRFTLNAILTARMLIGRLARSDLAYWRNWKKQNKNRSVDVAIDSSDRLPPFVHAISEVAAGLRSIRRFLRSTSNASSKMRSDSLEAHS